MTNNISTQILSILFFHKLIIITSLLLTIYCCCCITEQSLVDDIVDGVSVGVGVSDNDDSENLKIIFSNINNNSRCENNNIIINNYKGKNVTIFTALEKLRKLNDKLTEYTEIPSNIWLDSLQSISTILNSISEKYVSIIYIYELISNSLKILSTLIESSHVWHNLTSVERIKSATIIFNSLTELSWKINAKIEEGYVSNFYFTSSSIHVRANTIYADQVNIYFQFDTYEAELPIEGLNFTSKHVFGIAAMLVYNLTNYLSLENYLVNSNIISIVVDQNKHAIQLNSPHRLMLT